MCVSWYYDHVANEVDGLSMAPGRDARDSAIEGFNLGLSGRSVSSVIVPTPSSTKEKNRSESDQNMLPVLATPCEQLRRRETILVSIYVLHTQMSSFMDILTMLDMVEADVRSGKKIRRDVDELSWSFTTG